MCGERNNYIHYVNTWWWGKSITLIRKGGYSKVELAFDDDMPNTVTIRGLMVFTTRRRSGIGAEMMKCCEDIAREQKMRFLQLSANKDQSWLVDWYTRLGFVTIMKDEHEYTMIKKL